MYRIEEEQSFEELKILRELVHERFHKQEELAEVGDPPREPVFTPSMLSASGGTKNEEWHLMPCLCLWSSRVLILIDTEPTGASAGSSGRLSWRPRPRGRQRDAAVPSVLVSWLGWLVWAAEP